MNKFKKFLSPRRFWHNIWTHFPVPMGICLTISLGFFLYDLIWDTIGLDGLIMALTFSTAASCIRRRFGVPMYYVWAAAVVGFVVGSILDNADISYWFNVFMIGVCVIVSCWTRRFYLQILFVAGWFVICLFIAGWLVMLDISIFRDTFFVAFLMIASPFILAPFLFLGGLPFGDEDFD